MKRKTMTPGDAAYLLFGSQMKEEGFDPGEAQFRSGADIAEGLAEFFSFTQKDYIRIASELRGHHPYVAWGADYLIDGHGFWVAPWDDDGPIGPEQKFTNHRDALEAAHQLGIEMNLEVWEVDEHGPLPKREEKQ